ncbi:MAG: hypothetical protein M3Q36_03170 [bacterium]|nr:hypothetical protein [bacterium]
MKIPENSLPQYRASVLAALQDRLVTARTLDSHLIRTPDTSDRYIIGVTDQKKEQVPEACSRILLRPKRKHLKRDGVDRLFVYLPDDILDSESTDTSVSRAYLKQIRAQRTSRFMLNLNQLAPYRDLDDIEVISDEETGPRYAVAESLEFGEIDEAAELWLLEHIADKSQSDAYFLKSQNVRL